MEEFLTLHISSTQYVCPKCICLFFCNGYDELVTGFCVPNSVCNHTHDRQIGLPLCSCLILLMTCMIIDRSGLHLVLLPLLKLLLLLQLSRVSCIFVHIVQNNNSKNPLRKFYMLYSCSLEGDS